MKSITRFASAFAVIGTLALAGCGGSAEVEQPTKTPEPSATVQAIPSPNADQTKQLVKAIGKVDPALANEPSKKVAESRIVDHSRNTCQKIQAGAKPATVQRYVRLEFSGAQEGDRTDAQVKKIINAIKGNGFCKTS